MNLREYHNTQVPIQTAWALILESFCLGNEKVLAMAQSRYTLYFNIKNGLPIHMTTNHTLCPALLTAMDRPITTQNVYLCDDDISITFHMHQLHDEQSWSMECTGQQGIRTVKSAHDRMRIHGLIPALTPQATVQPPARS